MQKMTQNLDITAISGDARRQRMKEILTALDHKIAADKGSEVCYHQSDQTGQSPITETVVLVDGRQVPYSHAQQKYIDNVFLKCLDPHAPLPEIPPALSNIRVSDSHYTEDPMRKLLSSSMDKGVKAEDDDLSMQI